MRSFRNRAALALLSVLGLAACDNSGAGLGFTTPAANVVRVLVFLDRDGSHSLGVPADTVYRGATVALLRKGTTDTVATQASDALGFALFPNVALGDYTVGVANAGLGDSVLVTSVDTTLNRPPTDLPTTDIKVRVLDDTTDVLVRLSYPEVSVHQARASVAGKRLFLRGLILAPFPLYRDGSAYLMDTSGQIRLTGITLRGIGSLVPGDSVTVLGLTTSQLGQPILDQAVITKLTTRPAPFPTITTTGVAANASTGAFDAALVQVNSVLISDTATVSPDFKIVGSDGTGSITIILDANIPFNRTGLIPGAPRINVKGILVPDGAGGWSLKPRDRNDIF